MKSRKCALIGVCVAGLALAISTATEAEEVSNPAVHEFAEQVLAEHPALRKARAEVDAAKARARGQSRPLYNPEIEFGYEDALDETTEIGISQTIDLSGKRSARTSVANTEVTAAQARLVITRNALFADLLIAVSDFQTKQELLRIANQRVTLETDFLALAERRNKAGDLPKTELLTARLSFAEANAAASAAKFEHSEATERLYAVAGEELPPLPPLGATAPDPQLWSGDVEIDALPELRLARAETDTARARIHVARRNRIPDPTIGLSVGDQRSRAPNGEVESTTLFGVRLSIPIPVRNSYSAEVDAAGADLIAFEQSYAGLRRQVQARFNASHRRYRAAFEAWRDWEAQGAAPLEEQRKLLKKLWDAGEINAVDYIIQLNQTFATESAGMTLRGRLWTTWFDWLEASNSISRWVEESQ